MWSVEIVKARFWEACDVERRMTVKGMSGGGNAWPAFDFSDEDRANWVQADIDAEMERWAYNKATATPEISRWEEVFFQWTAMIPQSRRVLVWRWAQCIAFGKSFSKYCEDKGMVRATAYNRLDRVFENLTARLRNEAILVRLASEKWGRQFEGNPASLSHRMDAPVARRHHPKSDKLNFRTEASDDRLTTPAAIAEFAQHLADTNEARRKARLRKALRGVPGEQEAA